MILKIWSTSSTTIDLFLTNRKGCFMKSSTSETVISDDHKTTYTFLKSTYDKGKPKFVYYRCFKNFNKELSKKNFSENLKNTGNSFEVFYGTFTDTLDCYASLKKKISLIITNLWQKNYVKKLWRDPIYVISIIKIAHTRTGQTIKSNVTFARTFWRKQKLINLAI